MGITRNVVINIPGGSVIEAGDDTIKTINTSVCAIIASLAKTLDDAETIQPVVFITFPDDIVGSLEYVAQVRTAETSPTGIPGVEITLR